MQLEGLEERRKLPQQVMERSLSRLVVRWVVGTIQVLCASISACDKFVASGSVDCSVRLWQLSTGCAVAVLDAGVDVYSVVVYRQDDHDDQLRLAALGDRAAARRLMLFRTYNVTTTNAAQQF